MAIRIALDIAYNPHCLRGGGGHAMISTEIAAKLGRQFGRDGSRVALQLYEQVWRDKGRDAAIPYLAAAILLCRQR